MIGAIIACWILLTTVIATNPNERRLMRLTDDDNAEAWIYSGIATLVVLGIGASVETGLRFLWSLL